MLVIKRYLWLLLHFVLIFNAKIKIKIFPVGFRDVMSLRRKLKIQLYIRTKVMRNDKTNAA